MRWTTLPLLLALASPLAPAFASQPTEPPAPAPAWGDAPEQVADAMDAEFDGVPYEFTTDGEIVCIAMIQGWKDRLVQLLRQIDVIDEDENWIAGDTHLVNLGNLMGFGGQNLECLQLMHKLSKQAEEAGGKVHMIMGSTDFVNLRYMLSTMPSYSYEHLATEDSQARLDERLARMLEEMWEYNEGFEMETRKQLRRNYERFFTKAHLPGAMEFMDYYAPGTELGDWFRSMNTAITINDILFIAGGIHPYYEDVPLDKMNAYHRAEANKDAMFVPVMADVNTGPYVWRGLSSVSNDVPSEKVNGMLADGGYRMMVVGHSPSKYGESLVRHRVVHVDCNFLAPRDQAAYNAVIFRGNTLIVNNGGRERDLRVPPPLAPSGE